MNTININQCKQNIIKSLNQLDWDLYKQNCLDANYLLDPIYAYILIHLYITHSWIFISDLKDEQCNIMARFGLISIKNRSNGFYSISDLGRQYVKSYLPHYKRIFLIDLLTILFKKLVDLAVVIGSFKILEPYKTPYSLIPSMPMLSAVILLGASIILGCICGFLIIRMMILYIPFRIYKLEPRANRISFTGFIDQFYGSNWITNNSSAPYSYLINLLNNAMFPDSSRLSLLSTHGFNLKNLNRNLLLPSERNGIL